MLAVRTLALLGAIFPSLWGIADSLQASEDLQELKSLSLQELFDIEVTIAGKTAQKAGDTAAAVFVITSEDIQRSGLTTIPDLLRMVPGLNVARIDGAKWAVSSRGFNGRFANKLLVLMDGRSVYTPLFSGVYWEMQDTLLADIDRIEVIRGPGATAWGANAVNGVINIITKQAIDTLGGLFYTRVGDEDKITVGGRFGGEVDENMHYRVYAKYFDRDHQILPGGSAANDDFDGLRGGFRLDWQKDYANDFTVQGDIYDAEYGEQIFYPTLDAISTGNLNLVDERVDLSSSSLLARWTENQTESSQQQIQIYFDHFKHNQSQINVTRNTFDLEYQRQFVLWDRHNMVWGLGYRHTKDKVLTSDFARLLPSKKTLSLYSMFLQDEISLLEDKAALTVGAKFQHNEYTGVEVEPSIRFLHKIDDSRVVWLAVSKALRTPGRIDEGSNIGFESSLATPDTGGLPLFVNGGGVGAVSSEELISYEAGYRWTISDKVKFDLALFYSDYQKLRSIETVSVSVEAEPFPYLSIKQIIDSQLEGSTRGVELAIDWRLRDWWRVRLHGSFLNMQLNVKSSSTDIISVGQEGDSPEFQFGLNSSMNFGQDFTLDLNANYVDKLPSKSISDYLSMNLRLAWKVSPGIGLSLVVQNMLQDEHLEYSPIIFRSAETLVERSVYLQLDWRI
ncbi:MAG: TonB-dependent receptor [Pseudomonadales bacterium]|nr:TonB-dependent receptor [Pseudomonadales bacterium]